MTFKTINDGEQALILNNRGRARVVVGPQRVSFEIDHCHQDGLIVSRASPIKRKKLEPQYIRGPGSRDYRDRSCSSLNYTGTFYSCRCGWLGTKRSSIFLAMLLARINISSSSTEMDERNTLLGEALFIRFDGPKLHPK